MNEAQWAQVAITSLIAVVAAGIGSYVGVRVALTEIRGIQTLHDERIKINSGAITDHETRIRALERHHG